MTDEHEMQIGFCWYQPEQWAELKKVAADPEVLDDTYEEWRSNANEAFAEIKGTGQNVTKVSINIKELMAWCRDNRHKLDGEARSGFAAFKLQNRGK